MCLLIHWVLTILREEQRCYWARRRSLQYFKMSVQYFNTSRCCNRLLDCVHSVIALKHLKYVFAVSWWRTLDYCSLCVFMAAVVNKCMAAWILMWHRSCFTQTAACWCHTNWSGVRTCPADCVSVNLIQVSIKHILKERVSYVALSLCAVLNAGCKSQFLNRS